MEGELMATFNENGLGGVVVTHPEPTTYTYNQGTKPNTSLISFGIRDSAMTDQHWCEMTWRKKDDELKISFVTALSAGDKTILDGIVSAEAEKISDHGYFFHDKNPVFQVSTTSWTDRGTMNLDLDPGTYRIGVGFDWAYSSTSGQFNSRIKIENPDGTQNSIWKSEQEPVKGNLNRKHAGYGYAFVNVLGGNYDVIFQIKCSNGSHTAQVEDVHLEVLSVDGLEI
jgi:hypothetical protein